MQQGVRWDSLRFCLYKLTKISIIYKIKILFGIHDAWATSKRFFVLQSNATTSLIMKLLRMPHPSMGEMCSNVGYHKTLWVLR